MIENVHHTVYARSISEIIPGERDALLDMVSTHPALVEKRRFLEDLPEEIPERLLVWACMEGIAFAGAFAVVFYFKDQNKMPGLGTANQYIARDETMHKNFAVRLLVDLATPLSSECIQSTVRAFVDQEKAYYADQSVLDVGGYIEFVANSLLAELGEDPAWDVRECPLPFMRTIGVRHEVNFFEVTATQYEDAPGEIQW